MTYCFVCDLCGLTVEQAVRQPEPSCTGEQPDLGHTPIYMRRDYPAEGVMIDRSAFRSVAERERRLNG